MIKITNFYLFDVLALNTFIKIMAKKINVFYFIIGRLSKEGFFPRFVAKCVVSRFSRV